jgi:hypothetical protein
MDLRTPKNNTWCEVVRQCARAVAVLPSAGAAQLEDLVSWPTLATTKTLATTNNNEHHCAAADAAAMAAVAAAS